MKKPHSDARFSGSGIGDYSIRVRRRKTDWAGLGIGDAFKPNLDYSLKMQAQRMFYASCRKIQIASARKAGLLADGTYPFKVKPQLAPCYTNYPISLAAHAAVGLTGFLEFEAAISSRILSLYLGNYVNTPAAYDQVSADPDIYKRIVGIVTQIVQTRLILEDLAKSPEMSSIEIYRLFSASQQNLHFESLPEILHAVILYGDILGDLEDQALHPMTRSIIHNLDIICTPFFDQLATVKATEFMEIAAPWVRKISVCLADYLPDAQDNSGQHPRVPALKNPAPINKKFNNVYKFRRRNESHMADAFEPLNNPSLPSLFHAPSAVEKAVAAMVEQTVAGSTRDAAEESSEKAKEILKVAEELKQAIEKAGGQESQWEDMRSDRITHTLKNTAFAESPMQGNQTDGHQVQVMLDGKEVQNGEIFDRPIELSEDMRALDELLRNAQPIADALKRNLYPNIEQGVETERIRSNGSLDPARLAMADFSNVIFRQHRIREKADRRGAPVLLIACDGSASLNVRQVRMLKVLTAAWLSSTAGSRIQILAGLYHSGMIRSGISGPLIQWIYHPYKTPAISRRDAARALVALPDEGTGAQSDALSLSFMLEEAYRVARGKMVYAILISDCAWNRSFHTPMDGKEEVCSVIQKVQEDHAGRLHATLVALGVEEKTGFENLLDNVIAVPDEQLADYASVAEKIGVYVASCMKERQRLH
jgi:hypothetical protein